MGKYHPHGDASIYDALVRMAQDFSEFLEQRDERLYQYYMSIDSLEPLPDVFFDRLSQAFTAYRISGGMPAAAMKMIEKDLSGVETTLRNILQDYSLDFVKHATPLLANRISHVWKSLPSQLAKENRKFVYQLVRPGARAREYEDALTWLKNAGLIYKVSLCSTPQVPLKSYEDLSIFKIYSLDVGLLRVLADLSPEAYLVDNPIFKEYKGALAENYILQSLVANGVNCSHYWASGNKAEVEFIVQRGLEVIPVEVNNENLDDSRMVFYKELKERVKGLSMKDAILEVNHWCHEKVTYRPSDGRTSAPLSTVRSAYGRCGEQSTFAVAALRAVGIPARQVYTPRWAHTDDNHAWVEAIVFHRTVKTDGYILVFSKRHLSEAILPVLRCPHHHVTLAGGKECSASGIGIFGHYGTELSIVGFAQFNHAQQVTLDMSAGNETHKLSVCKPAIYEQVIKANTSLDGILDHIYGLVCLLHQIFIHTLFYRLPFVVLGIASFALLSSKSLNLLLVLSLLTMKREIEKELANAIGQHHGQTLITKDALLMNMRPDSSYEFGRHTSLRCISIINNQTNRLVMMNSCAA